MRYKYKKLFTTFAGPITSYHPAMTELNEKYLISRLKKSDRSAFGQLFEHYYPIALSFAKSMLHNKTVAEDLIQNIFMRIWANRENFDENKRLKNYLMVAIRNEVYYHLRSEMKKKHEDIHPEIMDHSSIDCILHAKEMEKNISETLASMPERRREIFEMSREDKLSNAEIAQRLDISTRTVEKHIENALADLRRNFPNS